MPKDKEEKPQYYLTLFKIKGHETWRLHLSGHIGGFDQEWSSGPHPEVAEKKVLCFDRVTGAFMQ